MKKKNHPTPVTTVSTPTEKNFFFTYWRTDSDAVFTGSVVATNKADAELMLKDKLHTEFGEGVKFATRFDRENDIAGDG